VGGLFKPYQIVRVAKAEVEADRIRAEGQIQITDLQRRAFHRFLEEEAKKQRNIEEITQQALPLLSDKSQPDKVEDDWITNFFDRCRLISDQEMQKLWSRVLAGEANAPGSFSKRTVNLLSDLDKADAELFTRLCGFGWVIGNVVPMIFEVQDEIYNKQAITFNTLCHLESIGLAQFDNLAGYLRLSLPKRFQVSYFGKHIVLEMPNEIGNSMSIGKALLTKVGEELARICGGHQVEGFFDYVCEKWRVAGYIHSDTPVVR
jgi:hypothetical protein